MITGRSATRPVGVEDRGGIGLDHGHVAVLEVNAPPRHRDHGRGVGGDEVLAVAEADDERGPVAEGDDRFRVIEGDRGHRVLSAEPAAHGQCRRREVAATAGEQVRDHLRVGVRREAHAVALELSPELPEVLDDAVVHHGDAPTLVGVRVGVALDRRAVGRPTRVAEGEVPPQPGRVRLLGEVDELARRPHDLEVVAAVDSDPGGVVAAVLEVAERLEDHGYALSRTHVTDDAAHWPSALPRPTPRSQPTAPGPGHREPAGENRAQF